jgi:two-component system, OmpR family, KDP operon response regulator KdpE
MRHGQSLLDVWGPGYADRPQYLRVYMGTLRQKLEDDPTRPAHLITELQVGYRLAGLAAQ